MSQPTECLRTRSRMECPECGYPYCEAMYPLNTLVPHTESAAERDRVLRLNEDARNTLRNLGNE